MMYKEQRVKGIQENDYGQLLHFWLYTEDNSVRSPYEISDAAIVTFEIYLDGASVLFFSNTANVTVPTQTGDDIGHCYYTIQSDNFGNDSAGTYWCRMKVNTVTSGEAKLIVKDEFSSGA